MKIFPIVSGDAIWPLVRDYADQCSWRAGPYLARMINENGFTDWERVFVATEGGNIAGYCTLAKTDCIPNVPYSPYIGFMFVDEEYRRHRLSEQLINKSLGLIYK